MLLDDLHNRRDEILGLASKYGATNVRVFGSVARGEETDDSDVDFLVCFDRGYSMFKQRLPLQFALEHALRRKVDLMVERELKSYVLEWILKETKEV